MATMAKRKSERPLKPHGTAPAIARHYYNDEPLCEACKAEQSRLNAENYKRRKGKK